jgi:hypothetical protein
VLGIVIRSFDPWMRAIDPRRKSVEAAERRPT